MATIEKEVMTRADAVAVWQAIRDIGALHTRLVPGFVTATRLEPGARWVTFFDGTTVREIIVSLDDARQRLAWTADSGMLTHYHSVVQVLARDGMTRIRWTSDFLPDAATARVGPLMEAGAKAMQRALDGLA